jgi:ubiquitin C-terminal hydrolase
LKRAWPISFNPKLAKSSVKSATTVWMRLKLSAFSHGTFVILNRLYSLKTTGSNLFVFVSFGRISPKALLLHLKRFIVEEKINSSPGAKSDENSHPNSPQAKAPSYELVFKKNKAPVAIPVNLSLDAFRVESDGKEDQTVASVSSPSVEYSLRSVVHHIGSRASSGHYTADAIRLCEKDQEPGDTTTADTGTKKEMEEKWVMFDDGNAALTTLERVTKNINRQRNAYMLLYTMNEEERAIV